MGNVTGEVQHARKWQRSSQPHQWLFNFLPTPHTRSVETSKHMAPNVQSGKISHVLCGGKTNHSQSHSVIYFNSTSYVTNWHVELGEFSLKAYGHRRSSPALSLKPTSAT